VSGIFISYRRDDSSGYAGRLYDRLISHFGKDLVFMDVAAIELGEDFARAIDDSVSSCGVLLALIGKQWLAIADATGHRRLDDPQDFVRLEIASALKRNVRVIPVLLQGAKMPPQEALPADLEALARRQALEIIDAHFHSDVDGMIDAIQGIVTPAGPASGAGTSGGQQVIGQIVTGENVQYSLHVGSVHGGVIYNVPAEKTATPGPRQPPVLIRPRPLRGMLDRQMEVSNAGSTLQSGLPVQFYGEPGVGKTSLLRHLAYGPQSASFPDGVVYLSARGKPVSDLLQQLLEAFFEANPLYKLSEAQIEYAFQNKKALILLDDVELSKDEFDELMNAAPGCVFLSTSRMRTLWGEGRATSLSGLPEEFAIELLEREVGKALTPSERESATGLCKSVGGNPLRVLQLAAKAQEEGRSLAEVQQELVGAASPEAAAAEPILSAAPQQREILSALAVAGGALVGTQHLAALTGQANVEAQLEALSRRGLVQHESPYRLSANLIPVLEQTQDFAVWSEKVLAYFAEWAERSGEEPERICDETGAILQALQMAVKSHNWPSVLRLGRAIEGALVVGKRWGAWERVLLWELEAARALNDGASEAWALHQLGSRALCLGIPAVAEAYLNQAIALRESIGDVTGAAKSRHNLEQLRPSPPPSRDEQQEQAPAGASGGLAAWVHKGVVAGLLIAVAATAYIVVRRTKQPAAAPGAQVAPVTQEAPTTQGPGLSLNPGSLQFGRLALEQSAVQREVTVSNPGAVPLKIDRVQLKGANSQDFLITDRCSGSILEPGKQCTVLVRFFPRAVGERNAELEIAHSGANTPATISLAGIGARKGEGGGSAPATTAPRVTVTSSDISFGSQIVGTEGAERSITLTNSGAGAVTVGRAALSPGGLSVFVINSDHCSGITLEPGQGCTVSVRFAPSRPESYSASLTIPYGGASPWNVGLNGSGVLAEPALTVRPGSLTFSNLEVSGTSTRESSEAGRRIVRRQVSATEERRVSLSNVGTAAVKVTSVAVKGENPDDFTITSDTCSNATLEPDARCRITVTFTPQMVGNRGAVLAIEYSAQGSPIQVKLSGVGTAGERR
jgi:hypothetical protein